MKYKNFLLVMLLFLYILLIITSIIIKKMENKVIFNYESHEKNIRWLQLAISVIDVFF